MGFNTNGFMNTKFKNREDSVPVPELEKFFDKKEKPVWVVKALGANEIGAANEAKKRNVDVETIITALAAGKADEKIQAIKDAMGVTGNNVPHDVVWRISMLVQGSVSPVCDEELAVKLSVNYSTVFFRLTNKILELTGKGRLGE